MSKVISCSDMGSMFDSLDQFILASQPSVMHFDEWARKMNPPATADHLCYKCADATELVHIRALCEAASTFLYQSIIAGRRIAIVRFQRPIPTALGDIWFLELSDQKPDGSQASGFDHIEIYPRNGTVDDLAALLTTGASAFEKVTRPHHTTFDLKIAGQFKVRLEAEALVEKIKREEMR